MATQIKKILVPVDNSDGATTAAAFAGQLAAATGASITLLHVYDKEAVSIAVMGAEAMDDQQLERARERFAERAFGAARKAIGSNVSMDADFRFGKPSMEIVEFAERGGYDLIVMGSRGQSTIQRILVGSVSSQVMHHAPCSVTIVR